ncbi:hypothetical protein [Acinetobacter guillouiae]|uniref:hypothetical protein n=1 Tax=Acinetobacter guillouiae TaxID=106649 RepID=UPI0028EA2364|nr:hypothetical protein [Acinetobacter guillouiae]
MKEIIMALLVLFGGLALSIEAFNNSRNISKLEKQGIEAISEPLLEYAERVKNGTVVGYNISPSFKAKDGGIYTCHGDVEKEVIENLRVNHTIKIRYLLNAPKVCEIDGEKQESFGFIMVVGIIMILGSIAYIYNRSGLKN